MFDYLIAGAGFSGAVLAERLATAGSQGAARRPSSAHRRQRLRPCATRRASWSTTTGRTSSTPTRRDVFDYLSRFTAWRHYEHRVLAFVDGQLPADADQPRHRQPPLRAGARLRAGAPAFFATAPSRWRRCAPPRTSSWPRVGRELYEKFFRGYTRKQWGLDPSELDALGRGARPGPDQPRRPLLHRHATRRCRCTATRRMFERMLAHPNINVALNDRLPRAVRDASTPRGHLHRPDRRVLRLLLRQAAVPLA